MTKPIEERLAIAAQAVQTINERIKNAKTKEEAIVWSDKYGKAIDKLLALKRERLRTNVEKTLAND